MYKYHILFILWILDFSFLLWWIMLLEFWCADAPFHPPFPLWGSTLQRNCWIMWKFYLKFGSTTGENHNSLKCWEVVCSALSDTCLSSPSKAWDHCGRGGIKNVWARRGEECWQCCLPDLTGHQDLNNRRGNDDIKVGENIGKEVIQWTWGFGWEMVMGEDCSDRGMSSVWTTEWSHL